MTWHLRNLGSEHSVSIPTDEEGYLGRECSECALYFKIMPGTGLEGTTACVCPYCGHSADQSDFLTKEQLAYAESIVMQKVMGAVDRDLKDMAHSFNRKFSGGLFSMKLDVKSSPSPISYYAEEKLETHVDCNNCTLKYAIYGVFGFCPDCKNYNSLQILEKNLELARKEVDLAELADDAALREHLIGDALENAVSAFDGFGRATMISNAISATNPNKAAKQSFQNLAHAKEGVEKLFGFQLDSILSADEWSLLVRCFQKRHLLAHKMGVVDEKYLEATGDANAIVGRKVAIEIQEVGDLLDAVAKLGHGLLASLNQMPPRAVGSHQPWPGTKEESEP